MMRPILKCALWLCATGASLAVAQDAALQPSDVVATRGGVALTVDMVDQKVSEMPEGIRGGYFDEPGRMARLIDSTLLTVQLARRAEAIGLSVDVPDDVTGLDRDTALANAVLKQQGVLRSDEDYLVLAKERYQARKKDYASLEAFSLQHVFIDTATHGQVAAKVLAEAVHQQVLDGEDFSVLVEKYSHDRENDPLNGIVDYAQAIRLETPLLNALSSFRREPGISGVLEGGAGYHILRLVEYIPPKIPPFEKVREQIVAQLKADSITTAKTTFMRELSLQDVELNDTVVQRLPARYTNPDDEAPTHIVPIPSLDQ